MLLKHLANPIELFRDTPGGSGPQFEEPCPTALGGNEKQIKRKRIFQETIVTTEDSRLISLRKIARSRLLKRSVDKSFFFAN